MSTKQLSQKKKLKTLDKMHTRMKWDSWWLQEEKFWYVPSGVRGMAALQWDFMSHKSVDPFFFLVGRFCH